MNYSKSDAQIDEAIGLEAGEWLLRLDDSDPDEAPEFPDLKCLHLLFPRCFQIELDRNEIADQVVGLAGVKETKILPVYREF